MFRNYHVAAYSTAIRHPHRRCQDVPSWVATWKVLFFSRFSLWCLVAARPLRQPGQYLAWNNLSALLAEEVGREDEAMETIDKAISYAAYDIPTLMDTKAVVLMYQHRYQDAVDLLHRKVTRLRFASDSRFFFHLAISLNNLDETDAAIDALAEADGLNLQDAYLTDFERQELQRLRDKLSR